MAFEGNSGIQVANQYGPRNTGATVGVETTKTAFNTLNFEFTGSGLKDKFIPPFVIPKGAQFKRAILVVEEAFSGVTSLTVGEGKAEATNGLPLLAADLAIGTRDVSAKLAGTWGIASATTKAAAVGLVVVGTVLPTQGRASLVIEYVYKRRDDNAWKADPATFATYKAQR